MNLKSTILIAALIAVSTTAFAKTSVRSEKDQATLDTFFSAYTRISEFSRLKTGQSTLTHEYAMISDLKAKGCVFADPEEVGQRAAEEGQIKYQAISGSDCPYTSKDEMVITVNQKAMRFAMNVTSVTGLVNPVDLDPEVWPITNSTTNMKMAASIGKTSVKLAVNASESTDFHSGLNVTNKGKITASGNEKNVNVAGQTKYVFRNTLDKKAKPQVFVMAIKASMSDGQSLVFTDVRINKIKLTEEEIERYGLQESLKALTAGN